MQNPIRDDHEGRKRGGGGSTPVTTACPEGRCGRVYIYFGLVGTAVRICSLHSNLFKSVRCELVNSGQPNPPGTDNTYRTYERSSTDFATGPCSVTLGQGCTVTWAAIAPDAENSFTRKYIARQASQTVPVIHVAPSGQI